MRKQNNPNFKVLFLFWVIFFLWANPFNSQIIPLVKLSGDSILYKRLAFTERVFYDLVYGNKPDIQGYDTSLVIDMVINSVDLLTTYKQPIYLKEHLANYDPVVPGKLFITYYNPECLPERTRPFVKMFYAYYLAFPGEFKDTLSGVYISVRMKNNELRFFPDQCVTIDENFDRRYIQNMKLRKKYRNEALKLYKAWAKKVKLYGLEKIRKENIRPLDGSKFKWCFNKVSDK
ncbi:MAG: hypothetical protein JST26_20850 [Bacteroidetes bacterium]|nr:hypothetical protein [Bacteroidota bacterium]